MGDFGKTARGAAADAPTDRVLRLQLRMLGLQRLQLAQQRIVFGIRNQLLVTVVIGLGGPLELLTQLRGTLDGSLGHDSYLVDLNANSNGWLPLAMGRINRSRGRAAALACRRAPASLCIP